MNFQLIEIRRIGNEEFAYLIDPEQGRAFRVVIEEMWPTKGRAPRRRSAPPQVVNNATISELEDDELDIPVKKIQSPPSIIPAHLQGVFMPPGSPGAAEERRIV